MMVCFSISLKLASNCHASGVLGVLSIAHESGVVTCHKAALYDLHVLSVWASVDSMVACM